MTRWFLTLISFLFTFQLLSQSCEFSIDVFLENGKPCEYCSIQLTELDSISLIDFSYTDSLGHAMLNLNIFEKAILKASQFGYRDSIISVHCVDSEKIEFELQPLSLNLDEVTIIDKIAILKKSGDTTTFNLEIIETGVEVSTFDIVQKFPGVDISGNEIFYHGRPLKEILLGDIDISDKEQVQLLESIKYDLINQIQIIENQNLEKALEVDSTRLGLVMKIELKQKARGSMLYGIEGGLGYKNVYSVKGSGVNVSRERGTRIEGVLNNSYEDMVPQEKNLIINKIILKELYNNRYKSTFEIPKVNAGNSKTNVSRSEQLGKIIYSKNFQKAKLKSINRITNLNGKAFASEKELFFSDDVIFNSKYKGELTHLDLRSSTKLNLFAKNKYSFIIDTPINISIYSNSSQVESNNSLDYLSSQEDIGVRNIGISPNYRFEYSKLNTTFRLIGNVSYSKNVSTRNYILSDSFLAEYLKDDKDMRFEQLTPENTLNIEHQLRVTHHLKNTKIIYNTILVNQHEDINTSTSNLIDNNFKGLTQLRRNINDNSLFLNIDFERWVLTSGLKQFYIKQSLNKVDRRNTGIYPYLFMLYEISNKWNVSSSFEYSSRLPNINQLSRIRRFTDKQQLETSDIPTTSFGKRKTFNLSLFRDFETGEKSKQFNLNITYTMPYSSPFQQVDSSSNIPQTSWKFGNITKETTFNLDYGLYRLKWKLNIRLTSMYRYLEAKSFSYGQIRNSLSTSIKYTSSKLSYHSQLVIRNTKNFQTASLNLTSLNLTNRISYEYKQLSSVLKLAIIGSQVGDELNVLPLLSIRCNYQIPKKNVRLSLVCSNINNLSNNIVTTNTSSIQSAVTHIDAFQNGNIMIIAKKLL